MAAATNRFSRRLIHFRQRWAIAPSAWISKGSKFGRAEAIIKSANLSQRLFELLATTSRTRRQRNGLLFNTTWISKTRQSSTCSTTHCNSPLSLLFQQARYHLIILINGFKTMAFVLFKETTFSVALCIMRMRAWWLALVFCSYNPEPRVFFGFLWRQRS